MGCSNSSPAVASQNPSKMQMMHMGNGMNMMGMDKSKMMKMAPMKFEYFDLHGRGIMCRFVLLYAKYCMWKDCPMT